MNLDDKMRLLSLPQFYRLLIDLLDTYVSSPFVRYDYMNDTYIEITETIENIMSRNDIQHALEEAPKHYTTLEGEYNDIVTEWHYDRSNITSYYAHVLKTSNRLTTANDLFEIEGTTPELRKLKQLQETVEFFKSQKMKRIKAEKIIDIKTIWLDPGSYDRASSILTFGGYRIPISKQENMKGKQKETREAYLMRQLFKDVNTLRNGISYRSATSVRVTTFGPENVKKVKNYISAINKKVYSITGVSEDIPLIISNQKVLMINSLYLLN